MSTAIFARIGDGRRRPATVLPQVLFATRSDSRMIELTPHQYVHAQSAGSCFGETASQELGEKP
jgi:hypothetical protein